MWALRSLTSSAAAGSGSVHAGPGGSTNRARPLRLSRNRAVFPPITPCSGTTRSEATNGMSWRSHALAIGLPAKDSAADQRRQAVRPLNTRLQEEAGEFLGRSAPYYPLVE